MGLKIGDVSPLGALVTGKGAIADVARTGMLGLAPYFATKNRGDDDKKAEAAPAAEDEKKKQAAAAMVRGRRGMNPGMKAPGMKKGGKVKKCAASKRGDGCAQRGKTRGKMV